MSDYYDGTKLLSLKDINGEKPEIFICTSNRSAGKTTYFSRLVVNRFLKKGEKFMLLYRFNNELDSIADKFFKDIKRLFFPDYEMFDEARARGIYRELFLQKAGEEKVSCGYAVALNSADQIKKYSHLFSDVGNMLFDEFQSETNHYCSKETQKLISIHTSVARGNGEMVRYVPLFMISNPVSLINPYYVDLGIADRLKANTRYLRGEGYVLEQGFNKAASQAQKDSAFNRAFANDDYTVYSAESVYLNDNLAFIEKVKGKSHYICTLKYEGVFYGVREFVDLGIVYCDDRPDMTCQFTITTTTEDHDINYVMLKHNEGILYDLRYYFERGCFRFKNLQCKNAVLSALCYAK